MSRNSAYFLFAILGLAAALFAWAVIDAGQPFWGYRHLQLQTRIQYDPDMVSPEFNFPPVQRASSGAVKTWRLAVSGDMTLLTQYYNQSRIRVSDMRDEYVVNGHNSIPLRGMLNSNGIFIPWRPNAEASALIDDLTLSPDNLLIPQTRRKQGLCSYLNDVFSKPAPPDACSAGAYCQLKFEYHGWQVHARFHATKLPPESRIICGALKEFLERHTTHIDSLGLK